MQQALIVIDVQNDYFPDGNYPLWNADNTLLNIEAAITEAQRIQMPVVLVQHIANPSNGPSPFFNDGTEGVQLHARLLAAAPDAVVVVKRYADSFLDTNLDQILQDGGIEELLICGMMTQNCVTHTALSKTAEKYQLSILSDCCTTVDQMIHAIALNAVSNRVPLRTSAEIFGVN